MGKVSHEDRMLVIRAIVEEAYEGAIEAANKKGRTKPKTGAVVRRLIEAFEESDDVKITVSMAAAEALYSEKEGEEDDEEDEETDTEEEETEEEEDDEDEDDDFS